VSQGMKHIKSIYALALLLLSNRANSAGGIMRPQPCEQPECPEILNSISGGNSGILLLEIIGGSFVILFLVMRIYERWFK